MDIVVTVPKGKWQNWLAEGDLPGEEWTGDYFAFWVPICPVYRARGDRIYVVCNRRLRGYAPLIGIDKGDRGYALLRGGGAVACTIAEDIKGFQGFRYRWWERDEEIPFPDWKTL